MKSTAIQWCDDTINPVMGCDGCELAPKTGEDKDKVCYACELHKFRGGRHKGYADSFFEPKMFPGRVAKSASSEDLKNRKRADKNWLDGAPRLIFVSDMGDALSKAIPFEYLRDEIVKVANGSSMHLTRHGQKRAVEHKWLWLTKQPKRMHEFSQWLSRDGIEWPENLWAGTSVTTKNTCHRLDSLMQVGNDRTVRFVSAEPLWEQVTLSPYLKRKRIHWVITGGESRQRSKALRPAKRFDLEWARLLKNECQENDAAFFLKQIGFNVTENGAAYPVRDDHGGDWSQWPEDLRVRDLPSFLS